MRFRAQNPTDLCRKFHFSEGNVLLKCPVLIGPVSYLPTHNKMCTFDSREASVSNLEICVLAHLAYKGLKQKPTENWSILKGRLMRHITSLQPLATWVSTLCKAKKKKTHTQKIPPKYNKIILQGKRKLKFKKGVVVWTGQPKGINQRKKISARPQATRVRWNQFGPAIPEIPLSQGFLAFPSRGFFITLLGLKEPRGDAWSCRRCGPPQRVESRSLCHALGRRG